MLDFYNRQKYYFSGYQSLSEHQKNIEFCYKKAVLDSEWLVIKREGVKILKLVLTVKGRSETAYFEPKKTGS
jgi:hypothetical protein